MLTNRLLLEHQLLRALRGLHDGLDEGDPQLALFELEDAVDGAPRRRRDGILEQGGVIAGVELHLRGAEQGLRGKDGRDVARQPDLHARFRERLEDDVDEGRSARRETGDRIHVLLVDHHGPAHRVEQPPGGVEMRVRRVFSPADAGHARAHLARGVRHGPDYRSRRREQVLDEARRDGGGDGDHELRRGHVRPNLLEQLANVLRLDGDDDHVRSARRRAIVRSDGHGALFSERLRPLCVPYRGDGVRRREARLEQPLQQDVPDLPQSQYRHTLLLHRRYSSSRVAASVFSSRYFTITGAYSEMPHRAAAAPGAPRVPGTTTAPAGISSGRSPLRWYTSSRTRP